MILTQLPTPGIYMNSQKLRIEAVKAISSCELVAPTDRAATLSEFFLVAAQEARKSSVGATTLRASVLDANAATVGQGSLSIENGVIVVYLDSFTLPE